MIRHWLTYLLLAAFMTACGGGGGGGSPSITFSIVSLGAAPTQSSIATNASHYYQVDVTTGDYLIFKLKTLSGDSDIAVFSREPLDQSSLLGLSVNLGTADDEVRHVATFTGTLYIEIGGFAGGAYTLEVIANTPPVIAGIQLTPQPAYKNTDLTVSASISDPENDIISTTYSWTVNNVLVAGATTATLASSHFDVGDSVAATITVIDSESTNADTAATTIAVIPITITASPPATVNEGGNFTFQIFPTDAGDPGATFTYEIDYGPSGMQVDANGVVTWTAHGAIFDTVADVNYSIRARSNVKFTEYRNSVSVLDPAQPEPIVRGEISHPRRDDGGFIIDDFNNDNKNDVLVTDRLKHLYILEYINNEYVKTWQSPVDYAENGIIAAIAARDLNNDNYPEIVIGTSRTFSSSTTVHTDARIVILDGSTRKPVIIKSLSPVQDLYDIAISDTDNDGDLEIIAHTTPIRDNSPTSKLFIFDAHTLTEEWQSADFTWGQNMAIGQMDNDVFPEIATSSGIVFGYDGNDYITDWTHTSTFGRFIIAADVDNNGIDEILDLSSVYSVVTQDVVMSIPAQAGASYESLAAGNLDADPELELVIADGFTDIIVMDYNPATNTLDYLDNTGSLGGQYGIVSIGDTDTDNINEILISSGSDGSGVLYTASLDPNLSIEWSNELHVQLSGYFIGGHWTTLAPGDQQAVFYISRTQVGPSYDTEARAITLDTNGNVGVSNTVLATSGSHRFIGFETADYDNDMIDEIIYGAANSSDAFIAAYDLNNDILEYMTPTVFLGDSYGFGLADVNGDTRLDTVSLTGTDSIRATDLFNQTLISSTALSPPATGYELEIADIDNDNDDELVFVRGGPGTSTQQLLVYGPDGLGGYVEEASLDLATFSNGGFRLAIGDLDSDGNLEIILAKRSGRVHSNVAIYDGALNKLTEYPLTAVPEEIIIEDTAYPRKNILVAFSTEDANESGSWIAWLDPYSGAEISRSPYLIGKVQNNSMNYANINNDAQPDLLIGTTESMYMTR